LAIFLIRELEWSGGLDEIYNKIIVILKAKLRAYLNRSIPAAKNSITWHVREVENLYVLLC